MLPTSKPLTYKAAHFITLKLSKDLITGKPGITLFDKREFCDELLKTLIFSTEHDGLNLYGFVMTSTQVHLIANVSNGELVNKIKQLKKRSENAIVNKLTRKFNSLTQIDNRENQDARRIFSQFLNSSNNSLWQDDEKYTELSIQDNTDVLNPISSSQLIAYFANNDRNYLQMGAAAFTKLMMKSMKI